MTKIRIHITRDVLRKSANCTGYLGQSCAFARAVVELFPFASVSIYHIAPFYHRNNLTPDCSPFAISQEMTDFIIKFDRSNPNGRQAMKEQSFELEIPDWALEGIDISDVHKILEESKTMELVEQ